MNYSRVLMVILVLCGFSFAVSLSCDSQITASGTYRPTSDLAATAASNCVNISVSNLLIDCNVTGTFWNITGNGAANAFFINGTGYHNITIQNCGIYNFTDYGFNDDTYGANNVTIIDSGFYGNGFGAKIVGNGTTVTDTSFIGSSGNALALYGNNPEVTGSEFQHNGDAGLLVRWSNNSQFTDNYFYNNSEGLSLTDGNHSTITYNIFDGDTGSCIYLATVDNADVQRNNMTGCDFDAVEGYDLLNTEFSNNTILRAGLGGFFINITSYGANVNVDFIDNVVNESSNFSISSAIVLHNVSDSEVRNNIISKNNNTGFGFMGLDNVEITGNEVRDNQYSTGSHGYGVVMVYSDEILFENNLVEGNGYDASTTGFGGMLLGAVTNSEFNLNNISDNADRASGNGLPFGVMALDLENVTFYYNAISNNNGTGLFLSVDDTSENEGIEVTDNLFSSQQDGATITDSPALVFTGNAVEDNLAYGAWVETCDGAVVQNNNFEGNANESAAGLFLYDTFYGTVADNNFFTNANGIYLSSTDSVNVTNNGFVANGVGLLDSLSATLLISGNLFNESTNVTAVALHSLDAVFSGNFVHDNTGSGLLVIDSGPVEISDNAIYNNGEEGILLDTSTYATVSGNDIYGNDYGVVAVTSDYVTASQNGIYNNTAGILVLGSSNALIDANTLTNNSAWEITLAISDAANVTNNAMYAPSDVLVGVIADALTNSEFSGNTVTGSHIIGYQITDGSTSNIITSDIVSGSSVGFFIGNSTDNTLAGTESYGNVFGYLLFDNATATITDATSHDNAGPCLTVESANATLDNFQTWGCGAYLDVDENSTINATDLWLGYDEEYGILYETIYINETTVADVTNVILNPRFVSINSTDTNVSELSVPATVYIRPSGTCAGLTFYNMSGFPQSQAEIIAGGATFTPSYHDCVGGGRLAFTVPSFSGYAAAGSSPSGGSDTMTMAVTGERVVGDELTITVMDGTTPLSGANVKVFYWVGGILNVQDLGNTNAQGKVTFTPAFEGSYKATATKVGYTEEEARFIISAVATAPACTTDADCAVGSCTAGRCFAEPQETPEQPAPETPAGGTAPATEQPECASNADCAYNEACSAGSCVLVPAGACGEYTNHAWIGFNCCADGDCGVGFACANHNCVQSQPTTTEVPGAATSTPASTPQGGTPWLLVVVAIILGAAIVWWLFVRKH